MRSNQYTRRKFLKGALATAGGLALPTFIPARALGLDGHVSPSNRIVMGCIGWGQISPGNVSGLMAFPEVQYIAGCEVDAPRLKACTKFIVDGYAAQGIKAEGIKEYHDFRDMMANPEIDAVNIGTPDHWHALQTIAACKAGKDVFCQKPLSLTIDEGKKMVEAVRRYGRVLQVGSQSRSLEGVQHACELVLNGRLGKLTGVKVGLPETPYMGMEKEMPIPEGFDYEMWLGPAPWAPYTEKRCHITYRWILDYSDGMIADWGAHQINIAQWGMGRMLSGPVEIEPVMADCVFPRDGLSTAATKFTFICTYDDGVKMEVSTKHPGGVTFEGEKGTISTGHGGWSKSDPANLLTSKIGPNEKKLYPYVPDHHRNFVDCVFTRAEPNTPVEDGHRTATICHMGNIAMLLGRKLKWDPVAEHFVGDDEANRMMSRPMREPWSLS